MSRHPAQTHTAVRKSYEVALIPPKVSPSSFGETYLLSGNARQRGSPKHFAAAVVADRSFP